MNQIVGSVLEWKAEEVWERGSERASMQMGSFPRDLLQSFISVNDFSENLGETNEDTEEFELSLGLSLNGRFGVDPKAKKIVRSCSISDFVNSARDENTVSQVRMAYTPLVRTRSLPNETEEEWRKSKELQTLRRTEAKRKRLKKQRNLKAAREKVRGFIESTYENGKSLERTNQIEQCAKALSEFAKLTTSSFGIPPITPPLPPPSQGSIGLEGTGSSGISQFKNQPAQAITRGSEKIVAAPKEAKEMLKSGGEDMPCVSTKGDGPNAKRIQGFLYKYKKGEEVMIVCVCHGTFLSTAEFVKQAGGGDVAHP